MRWRTFLEPTSNGVDSYVAVNVEHTYIGLKVADCTRVVDLNFDTRTPTDRRTARSKLQKLQRALDEIAAGIEKAS